MTHHTQTLRRRERESDAKQEPKPVTRVRRGHWRNRWRSDVPWDAKLVFEIGGALLDPHTHLAPRRYTTAEIAEHKAVLTMKRNFAPGGKWAGRDVRYLGPVFFPEDGA